MGKEFKNIDELFRSELGGVQQAAPGHVKANIDKSLGFNRWSKGLLLTGLAFALTAGGLAFYFMNGNEAGTETAFHTIRSTKHDVTLSMHAPSANTADNSTLGVQEDLPASNNDQHNTPLTNTVTENNSLTAASTNNNSFNNDSGTQTNQRTINPRIISENILVSGTNKSGSENTLDVNTTAVVSTTNTAVNTINNGEDVIAATAENVSTTTTGDVKFHDSDNTSEGASQNDYNVMAESSEDGESNSLAEDDNNTASLAMDQQQTTIQTEENSENPAVPLAKNSTTEAGEEDYSAQTTENETTDSDTSQLLTSDELGDMSPETFNTSIEAKPASPDKPWTLSLTSGINLVKSAYVSDNLSEKAMYNNSTNDKAGNQTNLDISYRLKKGLAIGTGIGFVNYSESYNLPTFATVYDSTLTAEPVYDSLGYIIDTIYYYGEKEVETRHTGQSTTSYFMIPIHFGTQILWKKFQFDLFASTRFNFLMRSSGGYISNNTLMNFDKSNSIYKPYYIDIMLGGNLHYNIWKNLLYITGTVKYRPVMGTALKEMSFNKSFDYVHFGMGLTLKF